jgi:hypothetical protein
VRGPYRRGSLGELCYYSWRSTNQRRVHQNTDPHAQFMLYSILLYHGRRSPSFLRSHKRWQPLIPLLMDQILVDMDPDVEDTFSGLATISGPSTGLKGIAIPIEARLRSLSVRLLYEVCRSSKLSIGDLSMSFYWPLSTCPHLLYRGV